MSAEKVRRMEAVLIKDVHALDAVRIARNDLVILTSFMAGDGYSANDIAYAVERPWKFVDVLAEAKAALMGRDTS